MRRQEQKCIYWARGGLTQCGVVLLGAGRSYWVRGGLTGRREVFNTGCGRSYWAQRGFTGCEEGLLGAGSPYCAQGDLTCAGHCGVVWSWRQGVSVGSDMIPSRASSGTALALMRAIKGGDQEAAGRCWFVASLFHSHAGPPNVAGSSSGPPWHRRRSQTRAQRERAQA